MLRRSATLAAVVVLAALPVRAQTDHLKCYKVRDSLPRTEYAADLGGLAPEPGCTIRTPAKLLCVATAKTNVTPTPPGAPAGPAAGQFLCYKLKCDRRSGTPLLVTDQFGSRTLEPKPAKLVCAPVTIGTTTSTTLPSTRCCQGLGGPLCSDLPAATASGACGGTLAAPGLVCDGASGNCATARTGVSTCCQVSGPICFEGPLAALACTVPDATVVPGVACLPTGTCAAP
jgi:hypothetical protein